MRTEDKIRRLAWASVYADEFYSEVKICYLRKLNAISNARCAIALSRSVTEPRKFLLNIDCFRHSSTEVNDS